MKLKCSYEKSVHTRTRRPDYRSTVRRPAYSTKTATAATAPRRPAAELNDAEMAPLPPFRFDGELPSRTRSGCRSRYAVLQPEMATVLAPAAL
jgi:hypothetical protein